MQKLKARNIVSGRPTSSPSPWRISRLFRIANIMGDAKVNISMPTHTRD